MVIIPAGGFGPNSVAEIGPVNLQIRICWLRVSGCVAWGENNGLIKKICGSATDFC